MSHRLTVTAAAATVATSLVLYQLVAGTAWFVLGAAAAAVTALAGTLTRLRRLPVLVCLAAGTAALLLYVNLVFSGPRSFARVAPTWASLRHLGALVRQGADGVHRYAPPVPASHGILLLATAGIGIIAIATDLLAVRLRRPALAGLPLLVLFCVPLSTSASPGALGATLVFCLAISGYLALLSAEGREKVRVWGRLVSIWQSGRSEGLPETRKLAAAGRRIGFAAALLAIVVPLLLPTRPAQRLLGGETGSGTGAGRSGVYLPDPLAMLNQQLRESRPQTVLTYRTTDPAPPYLQVYVLGQLSDNAWSMRRDIFSRSVAVGSGPLPPAPGVSPDIPGPTVRETIALAHGLTAGQGLASLPVPYPARSIAAPGDWRADRDSLTIFDSGGLGLSGLRYSVTAKDLNPTAQELRQSSAAPLSTQPYLPVPPAFSALARLARHVTAGRDTAYGRAVALQRWFTQTGGFRYSLNVPQPRSAAALISFLTKTKRGYCQQFAFAMAVLARLLGIPSRVVIGYTQGTFLGGNLWQVTTQDAHAWPELYFQGAGWLRFEPTPDGSSGPGQATAIAPSYSFAISPSATSPTPAATAPGKGVAGTPGGAQGQLGNARDRLAPQGRTGKGAAGASRRQPSPYGWLLLGLVGLVLVTPRSARSLTRRRRWLTAAHDEARANAAWLEVTDDLADHGISCLASESPRMVAQRVSGTLRLTEEERAALGRLTVAVERARYAREPAASRGLRGDVALIRRAVARSAARAVRWRARLLPASALRPMRAGLQQLMDVFGWLDRLTAWRAGWPLPRARRRTG